MTSVTHPPIAAPGAPETTLPPHREWEDLAELELPAITTKLRELTKRCATTRDALDNALIHLDTLTQIFLAKHSPMSSEDRADYLHTYTAAMTAGRGIFPPQEAYRSAITTLGMLVTDLIDVLPEKSTTKKRLRAEFDEGMMRANEKEEGIRKSMRGLVDDTCKGGESYALAVYMAISRQRFKNWSAEEKRFKSWAGECVGALL